MMWSVLQEVKAMVKNNVKRFLNKIKRDFLIFVKAFPPQNPILAYRRLENFCKSYISWKYGVKFERLEPCMIQIENVRGCNINCTMCNAGDFPKNFLSFDQFKKTIDMFPKAFMLSLYYWGEPFLSKETIRMSKYASFERNMLVKISSNFTVIPEPKEIIISGIYHIKASIDTFDEIKFVEIRKNGNLKKILSNLENLIKTKTKMKAIFPIISVNSVVMDENLEDLEDIVKNSIDLGVDSVEFLRFLGIPGKSSYEYKNGTKVFDILKKIKEKYSDNIDIFVHNFENFGTYQNRFCHYVYFSSVVDIYGNMFCQFFTLNPNFKPELSGFGNIFKSDKRYVLRKRDLFISNFRNESPEQCRYCPLDLRRKK